jgi:L-ascorbate metabolism protein UlaG (beta-lactamase superfamily)
VADAVVIAKQSNARVISVYEVAEWLTAQGVENCIPMNIGGSIQVGFCTIKLVKAEHSSSFPDGSYGGLATGFVVHSSDFTFYYAGDTALTLDMQLIPLEFNLDFAFLPVGDNFTMGIKDAAKAAKLVQCKKVIAMHFDTFAPIEINHDEAIRYYESQQLNLILPIINQTIQL